MKSRSSHRPQPLRCPEVIVEQLEQRMLLYGATVDINTNITHQTIDGFGAGMMTWTRPGEYSQAAFYDRIVNDLGATIARTAVWPTFEKGNDNNDPDSFNWDGYNPEALGLAMTFLKRLQDRGMSQFLATVWTPPAWMKTNQSHNYGGTVRPDLRAEFAEYLAAVAISAKRDFGVELSHLSPQNEPFFVQEYESAVTTDVQMRELIRATMRKFTAEGLDTQFVAPEEMAKGERYQWYVDAIANDPETANFPGVWGVHSATNPHWPEVGDAVRGTDHNLWMTESHGHAQTITGALSMAQDIFNSLTQADASAYLYWQWSDGGGSHSLMVDGQPAIKYHVAKHFYRYVRPGAVRIGATSSESRLRTISFKHPETGAVTHVLFNPNGAPANTTINLSGSGLPDSYQQYRTSGTENHVQLANVAGGSQVNISLPPDSIVTLYSGPDLAPVAATSGGSLPDKVNFSDGAVTNPLRIAAARGDVNKVNELIASGVNVNASAFGGYSALHAAAMSPYAGAVGVINALLDAGANIDAKTSEGFTPLHMAAMNPWTRGTTTETSLAGDKIRALTAGGASVTATDNAGRTPLHWGATMSKLLSIIEMTTDGVVVDALLDGGSAVNATDDAGFTPLDYAVRESNTAGAIELRSRGGVHGAGDPDTTAPTSDIIDVSPDPRTTAVDSVGVMFSEPVTGIDLGDLIIMRDGQTQSLVAATLAQVNLTTWRVGNLAALTGAAGEYMLKLERVGSGITDAAGNALATSASDSWTVTTEPGTPPPTGQSPFHGIPFAIGATPVTIEAEDYDRGGQGVAYHDTDAKNDGNQYRPGDGVDIMSHGSGLYRVGGPKAGEWLEYMIDVQEAGEYELEFRVSQSASGAQFHAEVDGGNVTGLITAPNTGSFNTFTGVTKTVSLTAGQHVLRLTQDANAANGYAAGFDSIQLTRVAEEPAQQPFHGGPFTIGATPVTIQAEDYDLGGQGVAYHDTDSKNDGGQYRPDDGVDIMSHGSGLFRIGGPKAGEWLEYTINVQQAGDYELEFRVSQSDGGSTFHAEVDGMNVTGSLTAPDTNSFNTFTTVKTTASLSAGAHVLRLALDANAANGYAAGFDWIKISAVKSEPPPPSGTPKTIDTGIVAYVRNGAYANTNFGLDDQMLVKRSDTTGYTREGYMQFDLTGMTTISSAALRLFGRLSDATVPSITINVHNTPDTTWSESGLTWNNKPAANATARGSFAVTDTAARWYDVDLTSFLQGEFTAGRKLVSLVLKAPDATTPWAIFDTDSTSNGPRMVITP